jgi:hypothetical protein
MRAGAEIHSARISACSKGSGKMHFMTAGILAAVLGLLIAAACLGIPQLVRTRRQQPNDDTRAYLKETGRSARDIARSNAAVRAAQLQNDVRSQHSPQPENANMS